MGQIIELGKLLVQLMPFVMELVKVLKGQPSDVRKDALNKALKSTKRHCEGVACPPELKRS